MRSTLLYGLIGVLLLPAPARAQEEFLEDQVARMLLVGARGTRVRPGSDFERLICDLGVGGVILFDEDFDGETRNIGSKRQLIHLTRDLQKLAIQCGDAPLLIAADVEGGYVNRMSPINGLDDIKSHFDLGKESPRQTFKEARKIGRAMSQTGVNWDLAPVVDLNLNPKNPVIGRWGRSFSADHEKVAVHAEAFVKGLKAQGVLNCIKHFPGHGSSMFDSHRRKVDISETADLLAELWPFKELIRTKLADCVMTAHIQHKHINPDRMVTISSTAISGFLRDRLHYDGLVLTDDLQMSAVTKKYSLEEAAVLAIRAGADMITLSNAIGEYDTGAAGRIHQAIIAAVEEGRISYMRIKEANRRILELKERIQLPDED